MSEEKNLLRRARRGEIAAFEELVRLYEKRVYALAYRSTGSVEDAQDIAQEVFLRAWRSIESFRGDSGFGTWLFRIAMNQCIDLSRRKGASPQTTSITEEDETEKILPDSAPTPEEICEQRELSRELAEALDEISPEHREIVLLRTVSGLSYTQIAETLEVGEGTVKSRLSRARRALRDVLLKRGNLLLPSASKRQKGGDGNA